MTPDQLVDVRQSPGPRQVFGTDVGSNKDWRSDESVVQNSIPLQKEFNVPATTWFWSHGLGFRPLIQVYNEAWEQILTYTQQADSNNLSIIFLYAATGFVVIR